MTLQLKTIKQSKSDVQYIKLLNEAIQVNCEKER